MHNISFSGVWELPLNSHYVETFEGGHCPYMDQCVLFNHDADQVSIYLEFCFSNELAKLCICI